MENKQTNKQDRAVQSGVCDIELRKSLKRKEPGGLECN